MPGRLTDDEVARQILSVFAEHKVTDGNALRRIHFFSVRDADFQRGIDGAVSNGWIERHYRDRYRYILTIHGRAAFSVLPSVSDALA